MTLHSADPLPPAPSERFNFASHLSSLNRGRSAKTAYIDDVGVLTFGELADRVARFAGGLAELGVRGQRRAQAHFSWDTVADAHVRLFAQHNAGRGRPTPAAGAQI